MHKRRRLPLRRSESLSLCLQMSVLMTSPKYYKNASPTLEKFSVSNAYKRYSKHDCSGRKSKASLRSLLREGSVSSLIEKAFRGKEVVTPREKLAKRQGVSVPRYLKDDFRSYSRELDSAMFKLPRLR